MTNEAESLHKTDFCMQTFLSWSIFFGCVVKGVNNEFTVKRLERTRGHAHLL